MQIVHGMWIPEATDGFLQGGELCLWMESDAPIGSAGRRAGAEHPSHLRRSHLAEALTSRLGIQPIAPGAVERRLVLRTVLLPSGKGRPLPSAEMLPYVDEEQSSEFELMPWQVWCYQLPHIISSLNEIHFAALTSADDLQLGQDLLFWHTHAQAIRHLIARDQYIPRLAYRELGPTRGRRGAGHRSAPKGVSCETLAGWEIVSPGYEALIKRHAEVMPLACAAGSVSAEHGLLHHPEHLLRHFSEWLLHDVVTGTPVTAALDHRVAGTLVHRALHPHALGVALRPEAALAEYQQWLTWRTALSRGQTETSFVLCFRLQEADPDEPDRWRLELLVAAREDPSLKLALTDYWRVGPTDRARLAAPFGGQFERQLLQTLGAAARIYPRLWDGMATEHPTGCELTLEEAFTFLQESAWVLEEADFIVIVPAWYTPQGRRRARVRLKTSVRSEQGTATIGTGHLDLKGLVSFDYQLSIAGQVVSEAEWQHLVNAKTPLVQFRGEWMELDREKMQEMLEFWRGKQHETADLTVMDMIKLGAEAGDDLEWDHDQAVHDMLDRVSDKSALLPIEDPSGLNGTLREYQRRGVAWLSYLEDLGMNPCLADDMGLGKTLQVITRLIMEREQQPNAPPTLIIAPTSVLGNWRKEIERFAPQLRVHVHQGSDRAKSASLFQAACQGREVILTSFALARLDEKLLQGSTWQRVVVDEAQNIKNPKAAQTRSILKLVAPHRLALTGTPVENRLRDLWSIFNFLNPGYLGKEAQFRRSFEIPIQKEHDPSRADTLKKLSEPFILRRLKTDKRIIDDLPDKVEQIMYCTLTPEQASLYQAVVQDVERQLEEAEGMQRRGLILSTLMRLKQICNHPAQFLADGSAFTPERSHKLERLVEMVDELIEAGESALVFTQFTEIGSALDRYLSRTGHHITHYLHGGTSPAQRDRMVEAFQDPDASPSVFILSLRAGGVGLNLTRANHVFHFDRWWNPAVEDQATDRAFRIGQRHNVFVHKFVTVGTMEEKIDAMIQDKKRLSSLVIGTDESWLTELDNDTFKDLIALRREAVVS